MNTINGSNTLGTSRTQAGSATSGVDSSRSSGRSEGSEALSGPQDRVSVSGRSRVMADATAAVSNARDVRSEKVASLKASIANGTYSFDTTYVANRLLSSLS
jgi:negative regulator of flagellin synthesis FlgM